MAPIRFGSEFKIPLSSFIKADPSSQNDALGVSTLSPKMESLQQRLGYFSLNSVLNRDDLQPRQFALWEHLRLKGGTALDVSYPESCSHPDRGATSYNFLSSQDLYQDDGLQRLTDGSSYLSVITRDEHDAVVSHVLDGMKLEYTATPYEQARKAWTA